MWRGTRSDRRSGRVDLRVLVEDGQFQGAQLRARIEAEFLRQPFPCLGVHVQRVGLPTSSIRGEHELADKAFTQRLLGDESPQLAGELVVAAEREVHFHAILDRAPPQLLEP